MDIQKFAKPEEPCAFPLRTNHVNMGLSLDVLENVQRQASFKGYNNASG